MPVTSSPTLLRPLLALAIAAVLLIGAVAVLDTPVQAAATPGIAAPAVTEPVLPPAAADEGGAGVGNAGASEWLPFALLLAPFLALMTGLLWLTFRIDHDERQE